MKKNTLKKITATALSLTLALSLVACSGGNGSSASNGSASGSQSGSGSQGGTTYKVGICNYVDDASLNQIVDNIQTQLAALGE